ncbi:TPA: minor capsid protein [Streptococcus suis]|nr:minor capsid protein [Streptococcus suis]
MGATVSVKVDLKGIEKKVSSAALAKGKLAIASQMKMDSTPFIPRKSGELRGSAQISKDGIRYPGPYARAQFYGSSYNKHRSFTFKRYTTPGTGKRWDLKASALHIKNWGKVGLRAMGVKA